LLSWRGRHEYDRHLGVEIPDPLGEFAPVHQGCDEVGQGQPTLAGMLPEHPEGLAAIPSLADVAAEAATDQPEHGTTVPRFAGSLTAELEVLVLHW
jgi:hypothetical protein